jgi:hypothetical protein
VIRTRGIAFQGTVAFVRHAFGAPAHEAALARLSAEAAAAFEDLREGSWKPLRHLAAYIESARRQFAPRDPEFYRRLGFFVGQLERRQGGFAPMVVTPEVAARMCGLVWRALYDAGRLESSVEGGVLTLRIFDFPAGPATCGTTRGAIEGLGTGDERGARAEETACRLRGDHWCEFRVSWS